MKKTTHNQKFAKPSKGPRINPIEWANALLKNLGVVDAKRVASNYATEFIGKAPQTEVNPYRAFYTIALNHITKISAVPNEQH